MWESSSLGLAATITRANPTFPRPGDPASPFSIVTTADGGGVNPITTALSVTSFAGLDGANISCRDANQVTNDIQDAVIMVFGKC